MRAKAHGQSHLQQTGQPYNRQQTRSQMIHSEKPQTPQHAADVCSSKKRAKGAAKHKSDEQPQRVA